MYLKLSALAGFSVTAPAPARTATDPLHMAVKTAGVSCLLQMETVAAAVAKFMQGRCGLWATFRGSSVAVVSAAGASFVAAVADGACVCRVVLCCAVLCCAVLCCAVLCCAVLCCAVLSYIAVLHRLSAADQRAATRAAVLLFSGVGWMIPRPRKAPADAASLHACGSTAGGRALVLTTVLPILLKALSDFKSLSVPFSVDDVDVRTRQQRR